MEFIRICEVCGKLCDVNTDTLKQKEIECNGEKYRVLYYECEQCKTKNIVQIDNADTLRILSKAIELITAKKDRKKVDVLRSTLNTKRKSLMNKLKKNFMNNDYFFNKNA